MELTRVLKESTLEICKRLAEREIPVFRTGILEIISQLLHVSLDHLQHAILAFAILRMVPT
jgi:hypothetical protein